MNVLVGIRVPVIRPSECEKGGGQSEGLHTFLHTSDVGKKKSCRKKAFFRPQHTGKRGKGIFPRNSHYNAYSGKGGMSTRKRGEKSTLTPHPFRRSCRRTGRGERHGRPPTLFLSHHAREPGEEGKEKEKTFLKKKEKKGDVSR